MNRIFFLFIILFSTLSASANEFDNLVRSHDKIFLYLYTQDCSYCDKFSPIYEKLLKKYKNNCKFIKVDANTKAGNELKMSTGSYYVPNVLVIKSREQTMRRIVPVCLLNYACIDDAVNEFVNK